MWLRTLAGAYAGQIREYSTPVGVAALRSGTAERVTETAPQQTKPAAAITPPSEVKKWQAPKRRTRGGSAAP